VEIAVLGSVNADIVYDVSRLPHAGETLVADGVALGAGGKASNAAVALARLGATPRLIGCIGDDALGDGALAALHRAGVATGSLQRSSSAPTGLATAIVVGGGENTIVTHLGANLFLRPSDIGPLDGCAGLLATLGLAEETVRAGIARARQAGIPVLVDTTPLRRVPLHREVTAVDLLSANRVEAELVTGQPVRDHTGARDAVAALHALGAEAVVLKLGADGALWSNGVRSGHVPAVPTEVVDPTGAGDAFMAALAHAWLDGAALDEATRAACALAARVVATHGAQGDWR
jgi:ribokinase